MSLCAVEVILGPCVMAAFFSPVLPGTVRSQRLRRDRRISNEGRGLCLHSKTPGSHENQFSFASHSLSFCPLIHKTCLVLLLSSR